MTAPLALDYAAKLRAPFAVLGVRTNGRAVTGVAFLPRRERAQPPTDAVAERAARELERWLDDPHFRFAVPLAPGGTPFQRRVWDALAAIPVGESRTYGELARALRTAPRAVGGACGANPIAVIVPCHRVVGAYRYSPERRFASPPLRGLSALGRPGGAHGSLGGFMGVTEGEPLEIKRWLLAHEGYRFGA